MKRYLFLLAWMHGSDSASDDPTNVYSQDDLRKQFDLGNEYIFAVDIHASSADIAAAYGYKLAFFNNYMAYDSLSVLIRINKRLKLEPHIRVVIAP